MKPRPTGLEIEWLNQRYNIQKNSHADWPFLCICPSWIATQSSRGNNNSNHCHHHLVVIQDSTQGGISRRNLLKDKLLLLYLPQSHPLYLHY